MVQKIVDNITEAFFSTFSGHGGDPDENLMENLSTRDGQFIAMAAQVMDKIRENPVLCPFTDVEAIDWVV